MNIDLHATDTVHGLTPAQLNSVTILGEKVRWGIPRAGFSRHYAGAGGLTASGTTRHQALNNLIAKIRSKSTVAMSKDRVKFKLLAYMFGDFSLVGELLNRSFGVEYEQIRDMRDEAARHGYVEIICRPSQFARFLIYRESFGFQNMFKELEAKLFIPEQPVVKREPVDLSGNPSK